MNFRSHTYEDVVAAIKAGKKVWYLDTGQAGENDVLIGDLEDVRRDIFDYMERRKIPGPWMLIRYKHVEEGGTMKVYDRELAYSYVIEVPDI